MNPRYLSVVGLILVTFVGGCASCEQAARATPTDWLTSHGGVESGPLQSRVECSARLLISGCQGRAVSIHILNNDTLTAYSWPNGDVFLSRGLVNALTDAELSAAIAHELGHLLNDGQLKSVVGLNGASTSLDVEERADATGTELLLLQHMSPTAMISMLEKVQKGGGVLRNTRHAIDHRIELLKTASTHR